VIHVTIKLRIRSTARTPCGRQCISQGSCR